MSSLEPSNIELRIERDCALVLFELLSGRGHELVSALSLEVPERNALWNLESALEKVLSEPLSPEYDSLLQKARKTLREKSDD